MTRPPAQALTVTAIPPHSVPQLSYDHRLNGQHEQPPMPDDPARHTLETVELFDELDAAEREALAREGTLLPVRRADVLVHQGDPADTLFIVVSGRFGVYVNGRREALSEIGPGQPIGEIAFLSGGPRTATVRALRDSLVLCLGQGDFERLAQRNPAVWRSLTVTLARRLAGLLAAVPPPPDPRPRTITLIRAGGGPMPSEFPSRLAAELSAHARLLVIAPDESARLLPEGTALESPQATRALNDLESRYDVVLYLADPEPTTWSEKAIRQADLVLQVGRHAGDRQPNPLERLAAMYLPAEARRLVLLHPTRARIEGTRQWLADRSVSMHHHVALDRRDDLARLRRFILGHAVGLVACGGGALCAAHVGLYRALREAGFDFDIMGGTSGGSAMAAAFALGSEPDQIDEAIHDIFVTNRAMRRYTWPRYSLLDHTHFDRLLERYFGGIDIEDLWIPYFAISTDLSTYDVHRHRSGDLWTAVRASGSIPLLFPPVYTREGHMLVDGCLLDNVPIRVMRELKSGPNVAISFKVPELERFDVDYRALPSRFELVRRTLSPRGRRGLPPAPGPATVLLRSLMANRQDFMRHLSAEDCLLVPPAPSDVGLLDWHRHREVMHAAHAWGVAEIARLKSEKHPAMLATGCEPH